MAFVAQAIRSLSQVKFQFVLSYLAFINVYLIRDTPRRILSVVSDPQPEPEPEDELFKQFAEIDEGFLAWHFNLRDANGLAIAHINRKFRGLGREVRVLPR